MTVDENKNKKNKKITEDEKYTCCSYKAMKFLTNDSRMTTMPENLSDKTKCLLNNRFIILVC